MQGNQRQQGNARGNGTNGGTNGSPGQRTLTMSLPRGGGSSPSSSSSESSDDEDTGERDRAQRRLLDDAISPHLADEKALFSDGDDWSEVREVESETAERATKASPDDVHSGWRSKAWTGLMAAGAVLGSAGMSLYNRKLDLGTVTFRVHQVLIAKINAALNVTDAAINNFRIDGGLITADSVTAGPLARNVAGYDILCGGFTLAGLEVQLSLMDAYHLYYSQALGDAVTLRFGSLTVPLLQVGTAGAQAQTQASQAQPSQAHPSSAKPVPETIRSLLAALRLGVHLGSIDVQLHSQSQDGFVCGVNVANGAVRLQPDVVAFKAFKELTKKHVKVDGRHFMPADLRQHVLTLHSLTRELPYGPLHARTLKAIPDQVRAALLEEGFSDNDRDQLQAVIDFIEGDGNSAAFAACDEAVKKRDATTKERDDKTESAQRAETAERMKKVGVYDTGGAAGKIRLTDVHGGVVGSQFASDKQTRGEVHVGSVHADGLDTQVGGFHTKVKTADVGPLDLRMLGDQVGMNLGGARASGIEASANDGTVGAVDSLTLEQSRASARTADVLHPTTAVEGVVHLGAVTAERGGGTSGDRAVIVDRAHLAAIDIDLHKRGDQQSADARGLELDVGGVMGALDQDTAFSASSLHLAPSTAHGERRPASSVEGATATDGSVKLGAVDLGKVSVDRPRAGQHVGASKIHLDPTEAEVGLVEGKADAEKQTRGHVQVGGAKVDDLDARSGDLHGKIATTEVGALDGKLGGHRLDVDLARAKLGGAEMTMGKDGGAGVESFELGHTRANAHIGDLSSPTASVDGTLQLGAMTMDGGGGHLGDRAAMAQHAYVGPTKVDLHKRGADQRVDASGLAVNLTNVAGTLDAQTAVSADALRLAPSTGHGDSKPSPTGSPAIGGSVTVGALDLDKLSVDRPQSRQHARAEQLHVGSTTATRRGDQAAVTATDITASQLDAASGDQGATVTSFGLEKVTAGGNTATGGGQLGVGTLTAANVDGRNGRGATALTAHADQVTVRPTEAKLDGDLARFATEGVDVTGIKASQGATKLDAAHVETGVIEGEHEPRAIGGGVALDLRLERLAATDVNARQVAGNTTTSVHVGGASLTELNTRAVDDGTSAAMLDGAGLSDVEVRRRHYDRSVPRATEQQWYAHEDKVDVGHVGIGRVALDRPEGKDDGRRDLEIADVDVTGADYETRDLGDRHGHLVRKAKLASETASRIAERKVAEKQEAAQSAPPKKPKALPRRVFSKVADTITRHLPGGKDSTEKAEEVAEAAAKRLAEAEEKQKKAAAKESKDDEKAPTKDRGAKHHAGTLHLDSFDAALSGFDDTPHVDSASLGPVTGQNLAESKLFEQVADLTFDVHDLAFDVDERGNGTVTVRIQTGHHMLGNLLGKKAGTSANKPTGLNDNVLNLTLDVVGGVIQLGDLELEPEKNKARAMLWKSLAKLKVGGNKLQLPVGGALELEHLKLDGLNRDDNKVLVGGEGGGPGGLHLGHLLENGLQTLIDRVLGGAAGLDDVEQASVSGLSVDGVKATHSSGATPTHRPADRVKAKVAKAGMGKSKVQLDSIASVRELMATLGASLGDAPTGVKPTAPTQASPTQAATGGMLDGLFSMLESVLGQAANTEPSPVTGQTPITLQVPVISSGGSSSSAQAQPYTQLADPAAAAHLDIFHTAGGGDCGIHAMFGTPQRGGTVRTADPDAKRRQLGDALDGTDHVGHALVNQAAFTNLFVDLLLQILTHQGGVRLESAAFHALLQVMQAAKQQDDIAYLAHSINVHLFVDGLINNHVSQLGDGVGSILRQQIIDDVMVSDTPADRVLRHQLQHAGGDAQRHQIIIQHAGTHRAHLRQLMIGNLDMLVGYATSANAPLAVGQQFLALQLHHATLGGHLRAAVGNHLPQLLIAYAGVVRNPGYYLHAEDLQLLAQLNDLELHVYRRHDQIDGQFVEQLVEPGTSGRADVFHAGVHYEQAQHH